MCIKIDSLFLRAHTSDMLRCCYDSSTILKQTMAESFKIQKFTKLVNYLSSICKKTVNNCRRSEIQMYET